MFDSLVALNVVDDAGYRAYREGMMPILESYGGSFRFDFVVSETLKTEASHPVNRVFVMSFPDRAQKERFFADPAYQQVRRTWFDASVQGVTRIAEVER